MRFTESLTCFGVPPRLERVPEQPWRPGLIHGPAGVGKSYRAAGMAKAARADWINAPAYIEDCRWRVTAKLDEYGDREAWRALGLLEAVPALERLVIDDVAAEKPTEFVIETLYALFEYRYSHELETVVTSNLNPAGLAARLGDRIASRIIGFGPPLQMDGPDRRASVAR